jgi:hypothetical protein
MIYFEHINNISNLICPIFIFKNDLLIDEFNFCIEMKAYSFLVCKQSGDITPSSPKRSRKRDRSDLTPEIKEKTITIEDDKDPQVAIMHRLLDSKRDNRFYRLVAGYKGDLYDIECLQEYLPAIYKPFADNLDLLKEQLCSLFEIDSMYRVSKVVEVDVCEGCRNNIPGQDGHMECGGCLHDSTFCTYC